MPTEADTCRKFVVPKLEAAGWETDPHSITEQRTFTDGRFVMRGSKAEREKAKRADFLLRYTRDFPIAVVEAKSEDEEAAAGMEQSKDYTEILKLKFAYATNGIEIIEFDYITGLERKLQNFPTPAELWARLRAHEKLTDDSAAQRFLTPANLTTGKEPRYYQRIAIDRAVQAILQGKKRVLLTMATGTGKTVVAFQICWKLWSSKWNAKGDPTRKPRILYLADRNFLVDDPKDKTFSTFGEPGSCPTIALFPSTTNQFPIGGSFSTAWKRRAPVKLYATRVRVPPVELDCSRPKAASGKKPRGRTRKHDAD